MSGNACDRSLKNCCRRRPPDPKVLVTTRSLLTRCFMTQTKRILIADDDECLLEALSRRFLELGVRVERACDGASALAKIDMLQPDLVILDVNMPSGSGLRVCELVAQDP